MRGMITGWLALPLAVGWLGPFSRLFTPRENVWREAGRAYQTPYLMMASADKKRDDGEAEAAARQYQRALVMFREVSQRYPKWHPELVAYRIAYCEDQLRRLAPVTPETRPNAVRVGSLHRKTPAEAVGVARRLLLEGKTGEAVPLLLETLVDFPERRDVSLLLGIAHCQAGDYRGAVRVLDSLVAKDPGNTDARLGLAAANLGQGRVMEARVQLEMALAINPRLAEAHYDLAQLLMSGSPPETELAARHYARSLQYGGKPDAALADLIRMLRSPGSVVPDM